MSATYPNLANLPTSEADQQAINGNSTWIGGRPAGVKDAGSDGEKKRWLGHQNVVFYQLGCALPTGHPGTTRHWSAALSRDFAILRMWMDR